MGSTPKLGAGTNIQDRLIALHHLDCPWKPSDLEQQEGRILRQGNRNGVMSNVRFDELELMLMAMFEQPTLKDTIQVLTEIQPLVAEDAEMAALVQQTIPKMQQLTELQFKGLELEWHRPEDDAGE